MRKNVTSTEVEGAEVKPKGGQKPFDASTEIDAEFQNAVEKGEIEGDVILLDEQGEEIKSAQPRRTIFDL